MCGVLDKSCLSVGEAVDDHDGVIVLVCWARSLNNAIRIWWNADTICSSLQGIDVARCHGWWERWLLLDDAALALVFGFGRACGRELARVHELADVGL